MAMGKTASQVFILSFILLFWGEAWAGSIIGVQNISFGTIVADAKGDVIEINAALGPAVPHVYSSGNSLVNGGNSGLIRVATDVPGELITLIFPATVPVNGGGATHIISALALKSTPSPVVGSGSGTIDFHLGGLLQIKTGQPDNAYGFDILVTVQFDNP